MNIVDILYMGGEASMSVAMIRAVNPGNLELSGFIRSLDNIATVASDLAKKEDDLLYAARHTDSDEPERKRIDDHAAYRSRAAEATEQLSAILALARKKADLSDTLLLWHKKLPHKQALAFSSLLLSGLGTSQQANNFLWALRLLLPVPSRDNLNIQQNNFSRMLAVFLPDPSNPNSHIKFNDSDINCIRLLSMALEVIIGKPFPIGREEERATGETLVLTKEPLAPAIPLISARNSKLPLILQTMGSEFYAVQLYNPHRSGALEHSHSALIYKDRAANQWLVFEAFLPGQPVRRIPFEKWAVLGPHIYEKAKIVALGSIKSVPLPPNKAKELTAKYGLKHQAPRLAALSR